MDAAITLATAPAILALVNLAKGLGLPTRLAALLAVVLGVALNVADHALAGSGAYQAAATGLVMGLGAAGLYDVAVTVAPGAVSSGGAPGGHEAPTA